MRLARELIPPLFGDPQCIVAMLSDQERGQFDCFTCRHLIDVKPRDGDKFPCCVLSGGRPIGRFNIPGETW